MLGTRLGAAGAAGMSDDSRWSVYAPEHFLRSHADRDWRRYRGLLARCLRDLHQITCDSAELESQ